METRKVQYKIGGISCSFCAQTIETAMRKTKGVEASSVNMAHSEALVEFDPSIIEEKEIKGIIKSLGYTVQDPGKVQAFEEEERELELEFKRTIVAVAIGFFVIFEMYLFLRMGVAIPYRKWILFALAVFVTFGLGLHILDMGYHALRRGIFNQHALLSFGVFGAMAGGILGFFYRVPDFFGIAVLLMAYHLLNGWISGLVRTRSSKAVRNLLELQPPEARILRGGEEIIVPVEDVRVGDLQVIRPGERIPVDGVVVGGHSSVDQSLVTGEPMPVDRSKGDEVTGGSINQEGFLKVKVTRIGEDTFLRKVARYVEESKALKPSIVLLADRVLSVYVPAVLLISVGSFVAWYFGGLLLLGETNLIKAVYAAISVLIIGYPCALGMATPMALVRGGGIAAEKGILIRSGEALQSFKDIDMMVMDKTG
ncbi:MAG: heavy metal translocating P-type ATPase, partial [Candidatus Hydrothermarchaeales archaeon]